MKIVLTGSLGHITKPLGKELINKGHDVTIISSKESRQKEIEALGAKAAIGSFSDSAFLINSFEGADIVYLMVPYPDVTQSFKDIYADNLEMAENYKLAIERTGVKKVIDLSTVGAHLESGNGLLEFAYQIEQILNKLPQDVHIKFMRPVSFYYNVQAFIPQIKNQGIIASNYGGDTKKPWVSPLDIATAIVAAINTPFEGREIQYIASEELSCTQVAQFIGKAIGQPDLQWKVISEEEVLNKYIQAGMEPSTAQAFVDMNTSIQNGVLYADYFKSKSYIGDVKFEQYAKEFAEIYNSN